MIVALIAAAFLSTPARAAFKVPGYELVYSYPVETTLNEPDLRSAQDVWPKMIDKARRTLDVNEFYVTPQAGEPLEPTLAAMDRAAERGVRIRVILEQKMAKASVDGIARLRKMKGLQLKIANWQALTGAGIVHAKYFVVDDKTAFVGSQNFDWRSLKHIHELGLAIDDLPVVKQVQSVFDHDWAIADSTGLAPVDAQPEEADESRRAYLVASPWRQNPKGVGDSQAELARLIGQAKDSIVVQNLEYFPTSYSRPTRYYGAIDAALRDAAIRGVKIKLLISHWGTEEPAVKGLQSLAVLPNVEVRIITIPEARQGPIPFARVNHAKYAIFDDQI
ncbi:MAG TPA: phospholipase D-like domain-containing protein, partial [Elusimicrobiota bacterium]|nr:phospholipase D-like domain-containing protein [Elusimicrobiota bacterium]